MIQKNFLEYVREQSENIEQLENSDVDKLTVENFKILTKYTEYLADNIDKLLKYTEYLAKNLDSTINIVKEQEDIIKGFSPEYRTRKNFTDLFGHDKN